jgi:hypothetical protein
MLGLYGGEDLDVMFNTVIFISKWEIWKTRNKVKYNQSRIGDQTIFNTWKNIKIKSPLKHISYSFVFTFNYNIHNWTIQLLPCISFMFINNNEKTKKYKSAIS